MESLHQEQPQEQSCFQAQTCFLERLEQCYFLFSQTPRGEIIHISANAEKILGISPEGVNGSRWNDLVIWSTTSASLANFVFNNQLRGLNNMPVELSFIHPDGAEKVLEVSLRPFYDRRGKLIRLDGIAQDITRRKRFGGTGEIFKNAGELAFFTHFANEMRTLLNGSIAVSEMLKANPPLFPMHLREMVDANIECMRRMLLMMDEFLLR